MENDENLKTQVFEIQNLLKLNKYKESIDKSLNLNSLYPNNFFLLNIHGFILLKLHEWESAKKYFLNSISLNKSFPVAYYNLGLCEINLRNLDNALNNFFLAIKYKTNYKDAFTKIFNILSVFDPKKNKDNPIIVANNLIKQKKFNYQEDKKISNESVFKFYNECNIVLEKYIPKISILNNQIHRKNDYDLRCDRHFKIFNEFNIIPKFCFKCIKVTVQVDNVLDFIKLHFVFDNLYLGLKNTRKLMLEQRKNVSGNYKGFIYCSNVDEAEKIFIKLKKILIKNIGHDCKIFIKRGCSEFAKTFPDYSIIEKNRENMMKYNESWREKEKIIDDRFSNQYKKRGIIYSTLKGTSLSDILVIKNWLSYAYHNNDKSFNKEN